MMQIRSLGCFLLIAVLIEISEPICVLESDFGFKINCAFKKSGLFRVRNLGGVKAHASIGFSLGDELGFEQSLTNLDPSRRRSVNIKNGAPPNLVDTTRSPKQEKRGKQNRIMMRPVAPPVVRPNQSAMDKLTSLHKRVSSTMQPIIVSGSTVEAPTTLPKVSPTITMAKPLPMGIPAFKPLPPKEETLKVVPITAKYQPLQVPESKGPGLAYQSEIYPQSHNQISKMVSQMTAVQYGQGHRITPTPIIIEPSYSLPTTLNPFLPLPFAPIQQPQYMSNPMKSPHGLTIIPAPVFKQINTQNPNPQFLGTVPHQVHDIASNYAYNTKKVDDYNTITGYSDDTVLKFNKEDINAKIAEIAKAGNISMEAVEAAIALRQQQLLNKYASLPVPSSTTTTTTTTEKPVVFRDPEPEVVPTPQKPKRAPTAGKVMNAPREYYPVGYEKNFDDHFQSKVDLPDTNFHCGDQKYFPGLYGDENLGCMVFHVCALTDDGLVMKSFLCPESTLFDQTILKCNWWFYVDCKNTRKLYDTNIPVSKSYQLMKALTFFSSYKKENMDATLFDQTALKCNWWFYVDCKNTRKLYDTNIPVSKSYQLMKALTFFSSYKKENTNGKPTNPEDVEGIKEAISILENQDTKPNGNVQIITPQTLVDERNNHKIEIHTEPSPVYTRNNRNINNTNIQRNLKDSKESDAVKLITVKAGFNFNQNESSNSSEERKYRRRMTFRLSSNTTTSTSPKTVKLYSTTTVPTTSSGTVETTTPSIEIIKQEIQPIEYIVKQETLHDQIDTNLREDNLSPVRRFYRSSAEKFDKELLKNISDKIKSDDEKVNTKITEPKNVKFEKEIAVVNNEKVQIVRPTNMAKLVGKFSTPLATIAKLDEAVLGNTRIKKEITIVTPEKYSEFREKT